MSSVPRNENPAIMEKPKPTTSIGISPTRRNLSHTITTVAMPAIATLLAMLAIWLWFTESRQDNRDLPQVTTQEETLVQANNVLDRANDAVNSAELILSFLEGASVIITIAIAAAAVIGLSSISELRDAVNDTENELLKRVEEAENRLMDREKQLANIEDLIAKAENRIDKAIEERLGQVYIETENARRRSAAMAHYSLAEQLAHQRNIDAAIEACEEAYNLDPENYANNYLYGTLLLEKDDYETSIKRLEEALQVKDDFTPAIAALGLATRRLGDLENDRRIRNEYYNKAETHLLEAVRHDPALLTNDGESYYGTLGSLYRRQERITDALDSYRRSAENTPTNSYPYVNLAMLYMHEREEQLKDQNLLIAERNAKRRITDTSTDFWALYDLGLISLMRDNTEDMKKYFKEAIEVTPASLSVYYSVISRLEFLDTFANNLGGIHIGLEMLDSQLRRVSTR